MFKQEFYSRMDIQFCYYKKDGTFIPVQLNFYKFFTGTGNLVSNSCLIQNVTAVWKQIFVHRKKGTKEKEHLLHNKVSYRWPGT